jgi:undecaprenyl-phosphate galactose phosphotransferase
MKLKFFKEIFESTAFLAVDLISIYLFFEVSIFIRIELLPHILPSRILPVPETGFSMHLWILGVWFFFMFYEGLYRRRLSFWDELKALWKVSFLSTIGVFTIVTLGKLSAEVSRIVIILMGLVSIVLFPIIRRNAKRLLFSLGLLRKRTLIVGSHDNARALLRALMKEKNYSYEIVGFVDDTDVEEIEGIRVYNRINKILNYIDSLDVEYVFITIPEERYQGLEHIITELHRRLKGLIIIPDMKGVPTMVSEIHYFLGEELFGFEVKNNLKIPVNRIIKRIFDISFALLLLLFSVIPFLIFSLIIKLDSPGPVIFSQERVGKNGKRFRCYKLRTMYVDADEILKHILENDPEARMEWQRCWKLKNDPRVTRVGRFLRKTSLDELPQLFNVIKGDMSLVGPRPVTEEELKKYYKDKESYYFFVHPGITGLWQVSGRSDTDYERRVALDMWYVKNWSLWLDIVILLKTIRVVLKMEGAR